MNQLMASGPGFLYTQLFFSQYLVKPDLNLQLARKFKENVLLPAMSIVCRVLLSHTGGFLFISVYLVIEAVIITVLASAVRWCILYNSHEVSFIYPVAIPRIQH